VRIEKDREEARCWEEGEGARQRKEGLLILRKKRKTEGGSYRGFMKVVHGKWQDRSGQWLGYLRRGQRHWRAESMSSADKVSDGL